MQMIRWSLAVCAMLAALLGTAAAEEITDAHRAIADRFETTMATNDVAAFHELVVELLPEDTPEAEIRSHVAEFRERSYFAGRWSADALYRQELSNTRIALFGRKAYAEDFSGLLLSFEGEALSGVEVRDLPPPSGYETEDSPLTLEAAVSEMRAYFDGLTEAGAFSGQVVFTSGGETLLQANYGDAVRRFDLPITDGTLMSVASVNKMLTATAVWQLIERGELDLETTVFDTIGTRWLAEEHARRITVGQLLTHRSGLDTHFTEAWEDTPRGQVRTTEDSLALLGELTPAFEPGTDSRYSNVGYLLLGEIVESVSGMDFFDYLDTRILEPAGMTTGPCIELDRTDAPYAEGYSLDFSAPGDPVWVSNRFSIGPRGSAAGGCYFTAADMARFLDTLAAGGLVSHDTLARALKRGEASEAPRQGYGFLLQRLGFEDAYGHLGGFAGVSATAFHYPERNWTLVILSNMRGGAPGAHWYAERILTRVTAD